MKKLAFISGVVVINIVLLLTTIIFFNPCNLPLTDLFFSGFDITLLFPSTGYGNVILIGSVFGLIFINVLAVRALKGQTNTLS